MEAVQKRHGAVLSRISIEDGENTVGVTASVSMEAADNPGGNSPAVADEAEVAQNTFGDSTGVADETAQDSWGFSPGYCR